MVVSGWWENLWPALLQSVLALCQGYIAYKRPHSYFKSIIITFLCFGLLKWYCNISSMICIADNKFYKRSIDALTFNWGEGSWRGKTKWWEKRDEKGGWVRERVTYRDITHLNVFFGWWFFVSEKRSLILITCGYTARSTMSSNRY